MRTIGRVPFTDPIDASIREIGRFEIGLLTTGATTYILIDICGSSIERARQLRRLGEIVPRKGSFG